MNALPGQTRHSSGIAAFILVALIWGSTWLVIKDQVGGMTPAWAVAMRFALASVAMFAFAAMRGLSLRPSQDCLAIALPFGLFQFSGNFQLVYMAEQTLTSGVVAVLYALLMVPNAVLARLVFGTRVSRRFIAGSAVALTGIGLLLIHEFGAAEGSQDAVLRGLLLAACAIGCASVANILLATRTAGRQNVLVLMAWSMAFGALIDSGLAFALHGPPAPPTDLRQLGGLVYLAIIGSVVTFPLYASLIRQWGPARAAYNGVAVPIVAMLLSTLFEGYAWSGPAIVGAALATSGLLLALSSRKKPDPRPILQRKSNARLWGR